MSARIARRSVQCLFLAVFLLGGIARPLPAADAPPAIPVVAPPKDVGELKALEERFKQVAAKVVPCVVAVRIGPSQGSGVVVSKDGIVLTAGHVIDKPGQKLTIIFPDGKTANGTSLGLNRDVDAGLAKITDAGQWPFLEMAKAGSIRPGSWCLALGHPLGHMADRPPVVRAGRVLHARDAVLHTDCPIVAGDSGGPVFDLEGRVIGINSRITAGQTSMNFHVPIDLFHQHWERMLKGEVLDDKVAGKDSGDVKAPFKPVVAEAARCVVRVKCDGKDAALGTVVGPDGWVLTKASQLQGKIACRTRDGQEREARLVGVQTAFDLAMLKIEASGLPAIAWAEAGEHPVGQWVATPGLDDGPPLAVGVVSVPERRIPPASGVLGIQMFEAVEAPKIEKILPDSAAQKAGLLPNDVVLQVNEKPVRNRIELINTLKQYRPGATVKLSVKRGDKTLEISATLTMLQTPATRKRDMQNLGLPGVSPRHDDFPKVLQHDTVLAPADCGGPLVDLSGRVIGVNIARAGRTETYAVSSATLLPMMYDLMSGRLAPPKPPEKKPEAKVEPPKVEPPKTPPKTEPPKSEPPKVEPRKPEAPKPAPPKPEPPKTEPPKTPPKVEPPKPPAPKPG